MHPKKKVNQIFTETFFTEMFSQALTCIPAARDQTLSCNNQGKEQYDPQGKGTPQSKE